jgi:hypothetical protein
MMIAPPSLRLLCDLDPSVLFLRVGFGVKMPYTALGDHGFNFAVQCVLQHATQAHFEASGIFDDFGVDEDLVGFAEIEVELILLHQLAILLAAFSAHRGGGVEVR